MNPPKLILVPTDFSDVSTAAVRYALTLAESLQAKLHFLHVVEDPLANLTLANGYSLPPNFLDHALQGAREQIAKVISPDEQVRFPSEMVVREGSPFVEIVRYAREQQVDLIVVGTHGRGAIAHMLLGSVAEQVLRKAPCPVMVVRKSDQPFALP